MLSGHSPKYSQSKDVFCIIKEKSSWDAYSKRVILVKWNKTAKEISLVDIKNKINFSAVIKSLVGWTWVLNTVYYCSDNLPIDCSNKCYLVDVFGSCTTVYGNKPEGWYEFGWGQIGVFISGFQLLRCISLQLIVGMWSPWNKLPLISADSMLGQLRRASALALYCKAQLLAPVRFFCSASTPVLFKLSRCSRCKKEMAAARKQL